MVSTVFYLFHPHNNHFIEDKLRHREVKKLAQGLEMEEQGFSLSQFDSKPFDF